MRIRIIPIDFIGQGAMLSPADPKIHEMAQEFIRREMAKPDEVNLGKLNKTWIAVRCDENDEPVKVVGIAGTVLRPDIPLFRATEAGAVLELKNRINDYYADQGYRGGEAFIYISEIEPDESRCPRYKEFLNAFKAVPAERYKVKCI